MKHEIKYQRSETGEWPRSSAMARLQMQAVMQGPESKVSDEDVQQIAELMDSTAQPCPLPSASFKSKVIDPESLKPDNVVAKLLAQGYTLVERD